MHDHVKSLHASAALMPCREAARRAALEGTAEAASAEAAASTTHAASHVEPMEVDSQADPYDFSDPSPVLSELKKEFWDGVEEKKWATRRDTLAGLRALASKPRLMGGDFGDLNRELRKVSA